MTAATDPSRTLWDGGWYAFARRLASPNFGPRPAGTPIDLLVVHSISLPPGRYGGGEVQRLFTNTLDWDADPYFKTIEGMAVSAHFFVTRGGELWQFVSCDDRAWHAGASSWRGRDNCNDFSVGIELEGTDVAPYEAAQYLALADVIRALRAGYETLRAAPVVGHSDVAPGRKTDPGESFDWKRLEAALAS